ALLCQDYAYLLCAYRNVVVIEFQHQCSPSSRYRRKAFPNGPPVCKSRRFMGLYSTTTLGPTDCLVQHSKSDRSMSVQGHSRPMRSKLREHVLSAVARKRTNEPTFWDVRFVPQADVSNRSKRLAPKCPYSITSSASASSLSGTVRPSALAVLRLITSSYLVGAWIGRSAGLSPLRMRATYPPALRSWSARSTP